MTTTQAEAGAVRAVAIAADAPPLNLTSPALRIMLDDRLFERCQSIARFMSNAHGMLPDHLIGQPAACFAVVNRALAWNLDPYAVGACTYPTPGGRVGFEGKLVHAVLEASGRLIGGIRHKHIGDWSKLVGQWVMKKSPRGKDYAAPAWKDEDEVGLGVEISAHIRGEAEPRSFEFWLVQAHPRNSTLWATDPRTQIVYLATRRFANMVVPHLFMGLPFDGDTIEGPDGAIDVTNSAGGTPPRPKREDFPADAPKPKVADDADPEGAEKTPVDGGRDDAATMTAGNGAPADGRARPVGTGGNPGGEHGVTEKAAGGQGEQNAPAADPRSGMSPAERERVEREADRMQRAAESGEPIDDEEKKAPPMKATPVPLKKDGSPDWIKWHMAVAQLSKSMGVVPGLRALFLAAHEPALRNYAQASPQNAAHIRALIETGE